MRHLEFVMLRDWGELEFHVPLNALARCFDALFYHENWATPGLELSSQLKILSHQNPAIWFGLCPMSIKMCMPQAESDAPVTKPPHEANAT